MNAPSGSAAAGPATGAGAGVGTRRRVAVITGASSGIGEAIARELAAAGWLCVLLARREDRLRDLATAIGAEFEVCDVGDREGVNRVAAAIVARHPAVDLLVNNAGIPGRATFVSAAPERIEEVARVNFLGGVWCLRAFLPALERAALERAATASVVNIASVAGAVAVPTSGPYSAAKAAQIAFSRAVAAELKPAGIRVLTVLPGFVETEGFPQRGFLPGPLGRAVVRPEYVAKRVVQAVERGKRELIVPRWYRVAVIGQWLMPWLVYRIVSTRYMLGRESF